MPPYGNVVRVLGNVIAVFFALASALVIAWGTVVRHRIAINAQSSVLRTAMTTPLWWVGTGAAFVAYGLQLVALSFGTLLVVQPVLVLSLMFTLPMAAWYSKRRMPPHEIIWSVALTIAVGILVTFGRPTAGNARPGWDVWWPAFLVGALLLGAFFVAAARFPEHRALALGCACGSIYGYVALVSKATVEIITADGFVAGLMSWQLYALIGLAGMGTVVQQYSFNAGELASSLPAMTIFEPICAFGLGYWVLGEQFNVKSALGWLFMSLALATMIVATVVLSRAPVTSTHPVIHADEI